MNINQLLDIAIERKASDLHLTVGYPPMLRVNGDLMPIQGAPILTDEDLMGLMIPILNPTQKQVFDTTFELDFGIAYQNKARFRVNLFRQQGHPSADLRLIPLIIPELESLGLPPAALKLVNLHQGLILVTGPTGHGKSTTLAAMINRINQSRTGHILTIEDPIEYVYPKAKSMVSQRELFLDTKAWNNALRAALREDPDVILVGEMRDFETIALTITAAETGHLVLATLHTNSAAQSIDRIIDVFPPHQQEQIKIQLAATLEVILSQRLLPTILPGRVLATELLLKTPALASIIRDGKTHLIDNLIMTSAEIGMVTMEKSLIDLIKTGRITFEMAQTYSLRPDLLAKLLGGSKS